ncbi:MAG: large conductance mechanosensitive channel protein MscL [Candidatus Saccharimonadales bacterium]
MFREFKKFVLRGNSVDLAVGLVIGAAFTSVVNALVKGFINPLASIFYDGVTFNQASFVFREQKFLYGELLNNLLTFLIVAAVVFFLVVQPINKLTELASRGKSTDDPSTQKCPYCLSEIAKDATRCKHCTSQIKKMA